MNNYKVRFNYARTIDMIAKQTEWQPITAHTPTEAILIVLNMNKVSMGQVIYLEIKRI